MPRHRVSPSASPMTGSGGASSTPRPLGSITAASGILDRPRATRICRVGKGALATCPPSLWRWARFRLHSLSYRGRGRFAHPTNPSHTSTFSRRDFARVMQIRCLPLKREGAGNAGCALHPRSRVPKIAHLAHTSIQGSGNTPTSPAQWLYGLLRALPGERAFLPPSLCEKFRKA